MSARGRAPKPPADAVALTAFRELPGGRGRQYSEAWTEANPWQGCEHFIRTCWCLGFVRESKTAEHVYAVLDAVNGEGEIVATYDVLSARGFRLHLPETAPARRKRGRPVTPSGAHERHTGTGWAETEAAARGDGG